MKTSVVKFFAGPGIRLAVLSVLLLGIAGVCMAQASVVAARPAPQAAKGTHEGIEVHGHWTIEVKNPDGTLVTHREFENSLVPSGAELLASILMGAITEGNWYIAVGDSANAAAIDLLQPQQSGNLPSGFICQTSNVSCSFNLVLSGPAIVSGVLQGSTLEFGGSGIVPSGYASSVGSVRLNDVPCLPAVTYGACATLTTGSPNILGALGFTSRLLDGQNGDPAAVPVSAGQTVAVTVVISFQ